MTSIYIDAVKDSPPTEFGEEVDAACTKINEACAGWGTDESGLIEALGALSPDMRFLVSLRFPEMFERDLVKVMASECGSGDFGKALQFCATSQPKAEATMVKLAMDGLGAREELMYPILCGRTNEEMALLKKTYYDLFGDDMAVKLSSELGGDFERFIFHCLQGMEQDFDPDYHTAEKVAEDVETFYNDTQGAWGTDEKGVFQLVSKSPPEHLKAIDALYQEKYEKTLDAVLDSELGGVMEKAVRFAVGMKLEPNKTISNLIHTACRGFGTNEMLLTSTIIRYESRLSDVNEIHTADHEKSIYERIDSETSGDYCKLLLAILGGE